MGMFWGDGELSNLLKSYGQYQVLLLPRKKNLLSSLLPITHQHNNTSVPHLVESALIGGFFSVHYLRSTAVICGQQWAENIDKKIWTKWFISDYLCAFLSSMKSLSVLQHPAQNIPLSDESMLYARSTCWLLSNHLSYKTNCCGITEPVFISS